MTKLLCPDTDFANAPRTRDTLHTREVRFDMIYIIIIIIIFTVHIRPQHLKSLYWYFWRI